MVRSNANATDEDELDRNQEVIPLRSIKGGSKSSSSTAPSRPIPRLVGILALIAIAALCFILKEKEQEDEFLPVDAEHAARIPRRQCPNFCKARLQQRIHHQGGDLLNAKDLLLLANKARDDMIQTLETNYGTDVFQAMFRDADGTSRGKTAFWAPHDQTQEQTSDYTSNSTQAKFRRKLIIKLLQAQTLLQQEESNVKGCDCITPRRLATNSKDLVLPPLPLHYSKFVWATGGHSAAAGHGNLYNESYTAFMERTVKNVFTSVGIEFVGRNYAMGGMASGPEIAMCHESLFGLDADLISWDFGMTDGNERWKLLLYANRIGMHRNKPALVAINVDEYGHKDQLKKAEEQGLPVMYLKGQKVDEINSGIPDMFGMSFEDMSKVAPWARDYKCKEAIEKGDPTCDKLKYNDDLCPERMHKASWHPGWRVQATYASIMSLFLSDMLIDAIVELDKDPRDPSEILSMLLDEEVEEYAMFYESKALVTEDILNGNIDFNNKPVMEQLSKMFRSNNVICHTALLPAEIRYLGLLTETDKVGHHDYETGVSQEEANDDKASDDEKDKRQMRLAYETIVRQPHCPVDLKWDYKDFFYTTENDGWTTLTIPNTEEKNYYFGQQEYKPEGVIMICFMKCDWGNCPPGDLQFSAIENGNLTLTVNGVAVTKVEMLEECGLLQHDGDFQFKPNSNGQFEFKAFAKKAEEGMTENFARITTFVIL